MALSMMSHHSTGSWQTVKPKADEKKKKEDKKKIKDDVARDRLGIAVDSHNVFAAIDRQWTSSAQQKKASQVPAKDSPYVGTFTGLDIEQSTWVDEPETPNTPPANEVASGMSSPPGSYTHEQSLKNKKPKAAKKPKITVQQVAQGLELSKMKEYVANLKTKYPSDELAQVMMLADYLLKAFREVDLPFNNLLQEKPLYQAAELPLSGVPTELTSVLTEFLLALPVDVLGDAVVALMQSIFEGLPETHKIKTGFQPPRAKVGILLLLALLLRAVPHALLAASPSVLAAGRAFTSGPRLLHLLWVLHQASLGSEAIGIAVWVRVLLPQLLCTDLAGSGHTKQRQEGEVGAVNVATMDAASQDAAVDYATQLLEKGGLQKRLQFGEAVDIPPASGQGPAVPAVPAAAVETIARTCFVEGTGTGMRAQTRSRLASELYPTLTELAASSRLPQQHLDWVPLALETVATLSTSAFHSVQGDEIVLREAACLLSCLKRAEGAFGVWEAKHKASIKGSSRVLQCLALQGTAATSEIQRPFTGLLADGQKREQFRQLLGAVRRRHAHYLAQGKGWQGAAARASEAAVASLLPKTASRRAQGSLLHAAVLGAAVVGTVGVLAAVLATHQDVVVSVVEQQLGPAAAAKTAAAMKSLNAAVEPHRSAILAAASPYLQQVSEAATPYLQQTADLAAPAVESLQQHVLLALDKAQEVGKPLIEQAQRLFKDAFPASS